ncbi:group III truncated hemoglobin [Helicobacter mesocricetorum]|uniref:group III truncated hemoglobin n=1 Tax=Helicobacter mesocricetorum TaxID=87012 RepID=UPI000CF0B32F|nr:group III truncated hemoglobin [Helicobacter mesocricetorum]
MKYQEICVEGINQLMDIFYGKIRKDKSGLGEIFNNKIGTGEEEWREHKAKISNFWQGMLLGSGDYSGQPMKAHLELPPFPREFFNTWLELFEESLRQVFEDNIANDILHKARMIADRFQYMLYESGH